jgi:dTDP-4-amino-4,6-dideoxygalactose transaminase
MHTIWPLGQIPEELQRPELRLLKQSGYTWKDPYDIVAMFEQKVAKFAGAKFGVAVDCCSHGLFLCLKYLNATGDIKIPSRTYVSVPMQIRHAGCNPVLSDIKWTGRYRLDPYPIWDAAVRWQENMYTDGLHVVSFQIKKRIPIGRGGMILTDDEDAYKWLQKARHDGRDMSISYADDNFAFTGWHYYMTPEDAARGILLMDTTPGSYPDSGNHQTYVDLSTKKIANHEMTLSDSKGC